ncbi:hypothetical protein IAT38_008247 [Cryptococcus sp. DSM 104549]
MVSFFSTAMVVFTTATSLLGASATPIKLRAGGFVNQIKVSVGHHTNFRACDQVNITIADNSTAGPWTLDVGIGGYYQSTGIQWTESYPNIWDQTYLNWPVTYPSGTYLIFQATNALGQIGYSQNHKVLFKNSLCANESDSTTSAATPTSTKKHHQSSAWVDNTAPATTSASSSASSKTHHRSRSSTGLSTPTEAPSPIDSVYPETLIESVTKSANTGGETVPTEVAIAEMSESSAMPCVMPEPSV